MKDNRVKDFKVGIFVTFGLAFAMVAILVLGGAENAFTSKTHYKTHFPTASGLLPGSKVVLAGVPAGTVNLVEFDSETKTVKIEFGIQKKFEAFVMEGSTVEVMTQGMLGDKYIAINPGAGSKQLPENSEIPNLPSSDMTAFLSKSDSVLMNANATLESMNRILKALEKGGRIDVIAENLTTTSKNMAAFTSGLEGKKLTRSLNEILEKINSGSGTLGALVNDPGLYEDARALVGGANRNRIIRNLVRRTAKDGAPVKDTAAQ